MTIHQRRFFSQRRPKRYKGYVPPFKGVPTYTVCLISAGPSHNRHRNRKGISSFKGDLSIVTCQQRISSPNAAQQVMSSRGGGDFSRQYRFAEETVHWTIRPHKSVVQVKTAPSSTCAQQLTANQKHVDQFCK